MELKLRQVKRFEKCEEQQEFAILFHEHPYWSMETEDYDKDVGAEPRIGHSGKELESFEWLTYPILKSTKKSSHIDTNITKKAMKADGKTIKFSDYFIYSTKGTDWYQYDEKADVLIIPGPEQANSAIDLGKGIFLLVANGEATGLLILDAKKKYEQAIESE